ncbi:MAG TPA: carboxypeptidase-like regulatory domain-containing protein [Thermoanaerobaculia bacterium]|nr:carboxypeptidase-like regulatory domain-containing protein [Thermoanaerobaculia bacterium]
MVKPFRLLMPHATYEVSFVAPHFSAYRKTVFVDAKPRVINVDLKPLPKLTGVVVDGVTGRPVPGAIIRTDVDTNVIADGTGRFTIEADPERWPKAVTASAAGYSDSSLRVASPRVSTTLDEIRLSRGGTVAIAIEQDRPGDVVSVELQKLGDGGRSVGATVQTIEVTAKEPTIETRFTNVEPGEYMVLAKGDEPWERLGERIEVRATEEAQLTLRIAPFRLRVRTSASGETLRDARVILKNRDALWRAAFTTDSAGEATVQLWQGGPMQLTLESRRYGLPYREFRTVDDGIDSDWLVEVPPYEIAGMVIDNITGRPIAGAAIALHMETARFSFGVQTKAAEDGTFRFAPVAPGQHTVSAAAAGYPPSELVYTFADTEPIKNVTLRLEAAPFVPVTVVDARGNPIHAARVMDFIGNKRRGVGFTDANGAVGVQVSAGETRDVYVIPRDGSLGFLQIRSGSEKETVRIADGVCRIVLQMESEKHAPIPNVWVAIRYNGVTLPEELISTLVSRGARVRSDAQGRIVLDHMPPGVYEFWPVGSPAELRLVAAGDGSQEAPVKVTAVAGENMAVMTFVAVEEP